MFPHLYHISYRTMLLTFEPVDQMVDCTLMRIFFTYYSLGFTNLLISFFLSLNLVSQFVRPHNRNHLLYVL